MQDEDMGHSPAVLETLGRRKPLFTGLMVVTTLSGYAYFAVAYFGPVAPCDPAEFSILWYASFMARTFDYHVGLIFLGFALAALGLRRLVFAATLASVSLIGLAPTLWSCISTASASPPAANLRVMTANLYFGSREHAALIDEILDENPDLLLLQEYTFDWHDAMRRGIAERYPYRLVHPAEGAFGAAIYSKVPLVNPERAPGDALQDRSPYLQAILRIGHRDIAVYNVHLVPPAWFNRTLMPQQFCQLRDDLARETRPMIVGGDFNFTRGSAMDHQIRSLGLQESFAISGWGRGTTFKVPWLPDIAIDHIYTSSGLEPVQCRIGQGRASDHRPIILDLHIDDQAQLSPDSL